MPFEILRGTMKSFYWTMELYDHILITVWKWYLCFFFVFVCLFYFLHLMILKQMTDFIESYEKIWVRCCQLVFFISSSLHVSLIFSSTFSSISYSYFSIRPVLHCDFSVYCIFSISMANFVQVCVPWRARTGQAVSRSHNREDLACQGHKVGATPPPPPLQLPLALHPAASILLTCLLSLSSLLPLRLVVLQFPCLSVMFQYTKGLKL